MLPLCVCAQTRTRGLQRKTGCPKISDGREEKRAGEDPINFLPIERKVVLDKKLDGDGEIIVEMAENNGTPCSHGNVSKKTNTPMGGERGPLLLSMEKGEK